MNTLSRALTAQVFSSADDYAGLCKHWSRLMNSERKHELRASHHLLYLALRGRDWRAAFTPPTNQVKLANGGYENWGLFRAVEGVHNRFAEQDLLAPFEGLVTPEMLARIRAWLPRVLPQSYRCDQFAGGSFPFEAYGVPQDGAQKAA